MLLFLFSGWITALAIYAVNLHSLGPVLFPILPNSLKLSLRNFSLTLPGLWQFPQICGNMPVPSHTCLRSFIPLHYLPCCQSGWIPPPKNKHLPFPGYSWNYHTTTLLWLLAWHYTRGGGCICNMDWHVHVQDWDVSSWTKSRYLSPKEDLQCKTKFLSHRFWLMCGYPDKVQLCDWAWKCSD